jgi:hypothetical protein
LTRRPRAAGLLIALALVFGAGLVAAPASPAHALASPKWEQLAPPAYTPDSPSFVEDTSKAVVVVRGVDNAIWYAVIAIPGVAGTFGWQSIPNGTTLAAPSVTVFNGRVYVFHTGTDGNYYYDVMDTSGGGASQWRFAGAWRRVPGLPQGSNGLKPSLRPAISASGDRLFVFGVLNNERIEMATMATSGSFSLWSEVPGGGRTESGVSATSWPEGVVAVAHRGTNSNLYFQFYDSGANRWLRASWFADPGGGRTEHGPSVQSSYVNGQFALTVAVQGEDDVPYWEILTGTFFERPLGWTKLSNFVTDHPPAIGYLGDNLYVMVTSELNSIVYQAQITA